MDLSEGFLFHDQFDSIVNDNFPGKYLEINAKAEQSKSILDSIIFGRGEHEKTFSVLDQATALEVLEAYDQKGKIDCSEEDSVTVQCTHCDELFTNESFLKHVCNYDENKILIKTVPSSEPATEFELVQQQTLLQLQNNQSTIGDIISAWNHPKNIKDEQQKDGKIANFGCIICNRKFVHESGIYRHLDKHIGELVAPQATCDPSKLYLAYVCCFCGELFSSDTDAWSHLQMDHIKVIKDELVSEITTSLQTSDNRNQNFKLSQENRMPTPNYHVDTFLKTVYICKAYQCEFCDCIFASPQSLLQHASKHSSSKAFSCSACELKNLCLKDFLLHRRNECMIRKNILNPLSQVQRIWYCNVCDIELDELEQLIEHRYSAFHFFPRIDPRINELMFPCEYCSDLAFPLVPQLISHHKEKHQRKPKTIENGTHETSTRDVKSPSSRRGGGYQTSNRPRHYLCEVCGKSYTQSSHLWQHLRFHQGVKPFACSVEGCERRFTIRPDLNDHIRKCHTGERPFLCTICGKRFLTGSVYYQHRLIHRGERRYGCEECGKHFYRADALKNHTRIHTGEKPYLCPDCPKAFRQRGDRDKHVKARHPNTTSLLSPSVKKMKIQSFGLGRVKNNANLYSSKPVDPKSW